MTRRYTDKNPPHRVREPHPPKAIIFDWDDTLVDHHQTSVAATKAIVDTYLPEPRPTAQEALDEYYTDREKFWNRFEDCDLVSVRADYLAHEMCHNPQMLPGAREVIETCLNHHIPIGVGSNKPHDRLGVQAHVLDVYDQVHSLVGHTADRPRKPEPVIFNEAAAMLKAAPKDIWVVGDTADDMQAAAQQGFQRVLVGRRHRNTVQSLPPGKDPAGDIIYVDDLHDLNQILEKTLSPQQRFGHR